MDDWINGCLVEWVDDWINGCLVEWIDDWINGCWVEWMDGHAGNIKTLQYFLATEIVERRKLIASEVHEGVILKYLLSDCRYKFIYKEQKN